MTVGKTKKKEKCRYAEISDLAISVIFTALIFSCAIFFSDELAEYVSKGLILSVRIIIPSVFPFLLITEPAVRFIRFERIDGIRRLFERLFHINGAALPVFVCGVLCGFPLGAKLAIMMYENGKISKCECERLVAFANNASPGYAICAVGMRMRGSLTEGILLYISILTSSVIVGILVGINKDNSTDSHFITRQKCSFAESVKSSATICIHITGFVAVFSIAVGAVDHFIRDDVLKAIIISVLEIGNAGIYLSDLCIMPRGVTLALTAFSMSFSGICVCAQTLGLINKGSDISIKKYVPRKLLQGGIAALLVLLCSIAKGLQH